MCQKFARNRSISYHFEDILNDSIFFAKIQDGRQKWRKLKFYPLHRILLYYPAGQRFTQNPSISYGFRDIHTFSFPAKMQDGLQKWRKSKFSPLHRILLYYPEGQKFARNRSTSYGFRGIHTFSFSAKIQDGRQKWRKLKYFLSLTVCEIFVIFTFSLKVAIK